MSRDAEGLGFTKRNGALVGKAYVVRRIRAFCRRQIDAEQKVRLDALLAAYGPQCPWWRRRTGYLVSALCGDAYLFAVAGDVEDLKEVS